MKHLRILGPALAVAVVAAMLALTAVASATTVTSPAGTTYTGTIVATNENGHVKLQNPAAVIECSFEVEGTVSTHGSGVTAEGGGSVKFSACTNGWTKTTNAGGTITAHWTSGSNGILTSSGATITSVNDNLGITCRYTTNATQLGTVTGGKPATVDIEAAIPFHSGSVFCGSGSVALTGSVVVTTPSELYLDK